MTNIHAKKSLGQNFLINPKIVAKIITAADLSPDDVVLEVGPGTGILTQALAASGARLIAIEKDHRLIEELEAQFSAAQIEIIEGDILELDPTKHDLAYGAYKIVANLPYYITSHFIRTVFEKWPQPKSLVLMVQREVAQRMMAKPPRMNLLALSVQYYADIELVTNVSRGNFRPEPNVDSAVIKLTPNIKFSENILPLVHEAFGSPRKTLVNNLVRSFSKENIESALKAHDLDIRIRPENLSLEDWRKLYLSLKQ